jgi:shikimate kinase
LQRSKIPQETIVPRALAGIAARTMSRNPKSPGPAMTAAIPAAIRERSIVLVGLMGSGKSTIGRRLAQRLGMAFADADDEIERAAGMTISDIFARFGEDYFREGERRVIARMLSGRPHVLATGGGAFINDETRALILADSICIWLDADIPTLVERTARRNHRPLLKGRNAGQVLRDLAEVRNPIYAEAHIRVSSASSPHEHTVRAILEELSQWKA